MRYFITKLQKKVKSKNIQKSHFLPFLVDKFRVSQNHYIYFLQNQITSN